MSTGLFSTSLLTIHWRFNLISTTNGPIGITMRLGVDRVVAIYSKFSLMAVSFISVVIHTSWPMVQVEWLVRAVCTRMARLPPPNTASAHPASPHGRAASAAPAPPAEFHDL